MGDGCTIRFDENDDVVIEDIPEDLMTEIESRAATNGHTAEDEMRFIIVDLCRVAPIAGVGSKSPLP